MVPARLQTASSVWTVGVGVAALGDVFKEEASTYSGVGCCWCGDLADRERWQIEAGLVGATSDADVVGVAVDDFHSGGIAYPTGADGTPFTIPPFATTVRMERLGGRLVGCEMVEERVADFVGRFEDAWISFRQERWEPVAVFAGRVLLVMAGVGRTPVGPDEGGVYCDVPLPFSAELSGCGRPQLRCLSPLSFFGATKIGSLGESAKR